MNDGLIHVDLGAIEEKPLLAQPGPYTFVIVKAEVQDNKAGDGQLIYTELVPQEAPEYRVFHRWSLKLGALQARSAAMSFRKFIDVMSSDLPPVPLSPYLFLGATFSATVKLDTYNADDPQVKLDRVIGPAA